MPRRSGEQAVKPFELRTGIGGLPTLGGMFRSGDPATVPPHKFHLLVNMRRTPGGLITRPGLGLVFNTGVRECINGLTEDAGEQGGAVILYPGAEAGSNPATFRAIFPYSSTFYSEFAFSLYGPAATTRGSESPVLAYTAGGSYVGPVWLSRPFIFRGQAVQFALVNRSGVDAVALLAINLAARSLLQASDCWRNDAGPSGPPCPGEAGQPMPAGNELPLWPFQHPVGSVGVLTYFDNPFPAYGGNPADITDPPVPPGWRPDASRASAQVVIDQIVANTERIDDALTGEAGVNEVLYFVARRTVLGVVQRRLVRWDGAVQGVEFSAIPDDTDVALGLCFSGPSLTDARNSGGFSALRQESGSWVVGTITDDASYTMPTNASRRAVQWGGRTHVIHYGPWLCGVLSDGVFVEAHVQEADGDITITRASRTCTLLESCEGPSEVSVIDVVLDGSYCYALGSLDGSADLNLFIGNFASPTSSVLGPGGWVVLGTPGPSGMWIQAIGGRVYVGGAFLNFNPETNAVDVQHHGVYDVTSPTAIFSVYRVTSTEQTDDALADRYSRGALPAVPNDETGGQGFQAS